MAFINVICSYCNFTHYSLYNALLAVYSPAASALCRLDRSLEIQLSNYLLSGSWSVSRLGSVALCLLPLGFERSAVWQLHFFSSHCLPSSWLRIKLRVSNWLYWWWASVLWSIGSKSSDNSLTAVSSNTVHLYLFVSTKSHFSAFESDLKPFHWYPDFRSIKSIIMDKMYWVKI